MEILIQNEQPLPVKLNRLRRTVKLLLQAESCAEDVEVSVLLTDDRRIRELNKQYRNIDRPTDVLSFSQLEEGKRPLVSGTSSQSVSEAQGMIGDIVISVETAARQAQEIGKDPDDEMVLLAAHGLLHLMGYDDETQAGADRMRERVAAALGDVVAA
jgi:probable rRNA maturation factor